ncbi:coiled-coil domain-containing protein 148-like [Corythoichthys intestinalis]|uniref:coiled-coil domain-containing protein 148-like n=1 Tax=Corythoichthys intestinalis TaxID=161448 RepID=UPI0025A4F8BF|nr:coiled-coil domain-containing protein 148-like [Corythoichthys intestinalis]XP_057708623.1 coiled-coil domain-containing protein 148-like [Corythoichthys intestinalis]XP_057708624.1 coiled-coil domain-containing protein 148-like [Corythoichthys intestinalis]XP_061799741.1 coiled-coil domain-containing protein 148-like [Nerophis lumbriciformis]
MTYTSSTWAKNAGSQQAFITTYRAEDLDKLTARLKNGLGRSNYKPTEYEKVQAMVDAKRLQTALIGKKVKRTRCVAKEIKESDTLRQHRQVWSRECPRLQKAEAKAASELHNFMENIRPHGIEDTAIFSLKEYEVFLERDRMDFIMGTVQPVHQLKEDLSFRLEQEQKQGIGTPPADWEDVQHQVSCVKDQQDIITAKLQEEYCDLDKEIKYLDLEKYLPALDIMVNDSIPTEVLESDCPYPELKESLIQAFHSSSEIHQSRLQCLEEHLKRTDKYCGWCPDDHLRFHFTLSQYTQDIPNNRVLCMHMLQRVFPEKLKNDLLEHERALARQRFTQTQIKVLTQQWQQEQEELLAKALATLQEARDAYQEELELQRDRQHQQDICLRLRDKLQQWRSHQEEVAELQAAIAARQQEESEAILKREQEREAALRAHQKEKLRKFHLEQQRRREDLEQRDQERLAKLRSAMEEQARQDKERVLFRAEMLQRRLEAREACELERQREELERHNRLEALRNQVAVVAESDSDRMMGDTQSWRNRHINFKEIDIQKPLFGLYTYTDAQIVADPRLRVEQALRNAGLHHTQYAQEVLAHIKPPKPPRRDTKSEIQF